MPMAATCGKTSIAAAQTAIEVPSQIVASLLQLKLIQHKAPSNSPTAFAIACASNRHGTVSQARISAPASNKSCIRRRWKSINSCSEMS